MQTLSLEVEVYDAKGTPATIHTRVARMKRTVNSPCVPRAGEWLDLDDGGEFGDWEVSAVIHALEEDGTTLRTVVCLGDINLDHDDIFDETLSRLIAEGWKEGELSGEGRYV